MSTGDHTYSFVEVYYIDDRIDLLDYVGLTLTLTLTLTLALALTLALTLTSSTTWARTSAFEP